MTAWLPEGKVTAASIGAALGGLAVWVLNTDAFLVVGGR